MYKSIILPSAKEDIRDAAFWYNSQHRGLGIRFTRAVREQVRYIQRNPKTFNIRYDSVRTAVLNVFPFMIHYTVDENNKAVIISAILHTSRDPELWIKR